MIVTMRGASLLERTAHGALFGVLAFAAVFAPAPAQAQEAALPRAPIQLSVDCTKCPPMILLPSGLRMSRSHVTRAEFAQFAEETGYSHTGWGCGWNYPAIEQADDHPVVCITYTAALAYVDWLSERAGIPYRLPTVEEYRYAAMGGQDGRYWWGQSTGENRANCIACKSPYDTKGTSPIRTFEPNPFGLDDAVGNAWQWTSDCHDEACTERLLIGGSWSSPPADLRVTKTIWNTADIPFNTYGLRVVTDQVPPS